MNLESMGRRAKEAARVLARTDTAAKNRALFAVADALCARADEILAQNALDRESAEAAGLKSSLMDRLLLTKERIEAMARGVRDVAALEDPVGRVDEGFVRPNGLQIRKVRVPLGVVGIIFEARPNVTSDAAALCLKSGNAVILRGGKEAIRSNRIIAEIMRRALESAGLPADCVQLVEDTARETAEALMRLRYLDVLIPRGGAGLIRTVVEKATVPVIETGVGNCHLYVDEGADEEQAVNVVFNAKTSRPSVCNALETLLVHEVAAPSFLPKVKAKLDEKNTVLRGCPRTREILGDGIEPATEEDWDTEYLDYVLAVRVVRSLDEALDHIARHSSGHSDGILTRNLQNARRFEREVDSAAVYVNASTRFTDGGEFGLGAEIGISTQKMHARGPMGLRELTTVKYVVTGDGHVR